MNTFLIGERPSDIKRRAVLASVLVLNAMIFAHAQSYSITSSKITAGGGNSGGNGVAGNFSVIGSLAQSDAGGASSSGGYTVNGGFLSQYMALQQIGVPRLIIRPAAGSTVQVVWDANVPGWVLQSNSTDLAQMGWSDVAGAPRVSGAEQFHQFVASGGRVFFRLRKL